MSLVEIQQFSYTYPGAYTSTLRNLDLSIDQGAFVVITGKSGSGKSTLGKAIAGFLFQDEEPNFSGKILVNDVNMAQITLYEASEKVAYVQQNPEDQFCTLTVMDEMAFGLENLCMKPGDIEKNIDKVLSIVKGTNLKDRYLATLSGGEKQKVAIASMLALTPDVLILDEPTSNLDPIATKNIFETLYNLHQWQELTIIIIEHKLSQLKPLNPEIYALEGGELKPLASINVYEPGCSEAVNTFPTIHNSYLQQNMPQIKINHLDIDLGGQRILRDINLKIEPGEFIALMGPNGSGKSTLLETMMGFHKIRSGSITIFNQEIPKERTSALVQHVGYIFQNPDHQLFTQSIWDEATFTSENLHILNVDRKSQAKEMLAQMGLISRKDAHPHRLSYGEKRRLNLIAAMLHGPQLLLIDELLIGQDMDNAHAWMNILSTYTRQGNTVVLVNHHSDLTQDYCNRVLFMELGQIIIDQSTSEAFKAVESYGYTAFLPSFEQERTYA
ncbi:MAG: ATP-binding cassette domain-containing protein [Chloroflexota bacterium]|nr:ATP-binding cassette domain-containing protein [Chloroflexota bacterium]